MMVVTHTQKSAKVVSPVRRATKKAVKKVPAREARHGTDFRGFEKYELDKCHLAEQLVTALYEKEPDATLVEVAQRATLGSPEQLERFMLLEVFAPVELLNPGDELGWWDLCAQ